MEKIKPVEVQFINEKIKKTYENIDDTNLKNFIDRAFQDIKENPFCGIQIPKRLIPKDYIQKYEIKNIWKYNLPEALRLIYSIQGGTLKIITIVLKWMDHKSYEKRFNYS
jgi:Txe/YoeB family toxin of Txe-Axe toxin-antitoxin module